MVVRGTLTRFELNLNLLTAFELNLNIITALGMLSQLLAQSIA